MVNVGGEGSVYVIGSEKIGKSLVVHFSTTGSIDAYERPRP
jgi:hypothetical protein